MFHRAFHEVFHGSFATGLAGLLLPRGCAGCDLPDETLCPSCRALFSHVVLRPFPGAAAGGAYACAVYEGRVRRAVLAWKDHGDEECDREFSRLLVALAATVLPPEHPGLASSSLVVVPAPSTSASLAARGRRHLMPLARSVASYYRSHGIDARAEAALTFGGAGKAVETVGAGQRASRAGERLVVREGARRRLHGGVAIVIDDIITTGATMRACAAALESAGATVPAELALAATPRYGASAG